MSTPDAPVISHERVMTAFADLNRMIDQQDVQTTAQSGAQGQR